VMLSKQDAQTALNNAATQIDSSLQGG
jgi:hypothetical protein